MKKPGNLAPDRYALVYLAGILFLTSTTNSSLYGHYGVNGMTFAAIVHQFLTIASWRKLIESTNRGNTTHSLKLMEL